MISVKIQSDTALIFKVQNNLNEVDFERISLYIESLVGYDFQTIIKFKIKSKEEKSIKKEIENYCKKLPYNFQIN